MELKTDEFLQKMESDRNNKKDPGKQFIRLETVHTMEERRTLELS